MAKSKGFETAIGKGGETHQRITPAFAVAQAMRTPGETTAETHVTRASSSAERGRLKRGRGY